MEEAVSGNVTVTERETIVKLAVKNADVADELLRQAYRILDTLVKLPDETCSEKKADTCLTDTLVRTQIDLNTLSYVLNKIEKALV